MTRYAFVEVQAQPALERVAAIVRRQIASRSGPYVVYHYNGERLPLRVEMAVDPSLAPEAFAAADGDADCIRITGGDFRGVLYGAGRFLRDSRYDTGWFTPGLPGVPGGWCGSDAPRHPLRGIYFASHWDNWYVRAPESELVRYLEDLALWGFNAVMFWYCMADYPRPDDPASLAMVQRLKLMGRAAQALGLAVYTCGIPNEPYKSAPEALRAEWSAENGYTARPIAWFYEQICPSKPGGMELILQYRRQMLELFADFRFDGFILWPYDQGGCTCAQCAPWGANGYVSTGPRVLDLVRQHHPNVKIVVSTWEFDKFTTGEFDGFDRALRAGTFGRVDYILAENHHGRPVPWVAEHGVPGGLPLLGFPEISMWGIEPWGGYGAIANPASLQAGWDRIKHLSQGGFPYSEGLFEDINKAICAGIYWNDRPAQDTLREYAAFEFGHDHAEDAVALINLLETSFPRKIVGKKSPLKYELAHPNLAEQAWELASALEARLPARVRRSWRWRLLYLRCLVDRELVRHAGHVSEPCEEALNELTEIYHYGPGSNYCMDPQRIIRHGKLRLTEQPATVEAVS